MVPQYSTPRLQVIHHVSTHPTAQPSPLLHGREYAVLQVVDGLMSQLHISHTNSIESKIHLGRLWAHYLLEMVKCNYVSDGIQTHDLSQN